jgi:hypothetical protein
MIDDIEKILEESSERLNLKQINTKEQPCKADADNQFSFSSMGLNDKIKIYLIAHKDVSVVYDFLKLSHKTIKNIEKARNFIANIIPEETSVQHIINKIQIHTDDKIELSIIGCGCTSFRVLLRDGLVSFSISHVSNSYSKETYNFENYDDFDDLVNTAVNKIIPSFIETIGFSSGDKNSPDVVDFIEKTAEQMFFEKELNPLFNYIKPNELVHLVCSDLNLNLNDVMQSLNYKENDSMKSLNIPNNLTTMISSIAQHLVNIDGIKYKFDQLISLIILYNNITNKKEKFSVTFYPVQKKDFFKGNSFNRSYYVLNISETLTIYIGHKLGDGKKDDIAYLDDSDDFKLFSFVYLKDLMNYDYYEYLTNDIDYVYNAILTDLRSIIKKVLCKEDDTISFRDLEVYKMAVF